MESKKYIGGFEFEIESSKFVSVQKFRNSIKVSNSNFRSSRMILSLRFEDPKVVSSSNFRNS